MRHSCFIVWIVLIMSAYCLSACTPSPERIAGQTATAEQRAVQSTVSAAKRTAESWTPTPSPEMLYEEAVMHCDDAFDKEVAKEDVIIESASLLTLLIHEWQFGEGNEPKWAGSWDTSSGSAIPFLEATSSQDVEFLLCIKQGRNRAGVYEDGAPAYRFTWSARLVRRSDGLAIAEESFTGGDPPPQIPSGNKAGYGHSPGTLSILKWLLPYWHENTTVLFHDSRITSIAFSPDGKVLAAGGSDKELKLWDVSSGEVMHNLSAHQGDIFSSICVAFSPDGSLLASGSDRDTVKLWDVSSGVELRTLSEHESGVNSVAFSPDGSTLATGSSDATVKLWFVSSGVELRTLSGHENDVNSVAFSPDGNMLASASDDHTVILWDLSSGKALHTLSGHTNDVVSIAFSPDGDTLASASESQIILWDVYSGIELPRYGIASCVPYESVAFSPDGTILAYAGRNDNVILSDVTTGMVLITLTGHVHVNNVAFSPDGILASTSGGIVKLWDIRMDE